MGRHPNATVAGGAGTAGLVVVWLLGHLGVQIGAEEAAAIAAAASTVALFIGRRGFRGLLRLVWRGNG